MAKTVQGMQIEEDRAYQRREWRFERIGWAVMAALLLAGLLGLLGDGPLSQARAGDAGTLAVDYDRLQRATAPYEYRFEVDPSLARDGQLRLRFDDALLEDVELKSIIPEPDAVTAGAGHTEFAFAVDPAAGRPARIAIVYQHTTFGHVAGRITADGAPPLVVDQFVFP